MEKEFIPYEQALALKELGFDEECLAFFWNTGKFYTTAEYPHSIETHKQNQLGDYNYDSTSAPLYQQAFRWLLALANKDKHFTNKWTISYNEDYYSLFLGGCNMGVFEAELECLKKLIEIVKEK